jgi:hypothetical protein
MRLHKAARAARDTNMGENAKEGSGQCKSHPKFASPADHKRCSRVAPAPCTSEMNKDGQSRPLQKKELTGAAHGRV